MREEKLVVHKHICAEHEIGQRMSREELQEFAIIALIEEYRQAGYNVERNENPLSGADITVYDGYMTILGKVDFIGFTYKRDKDSVDYSLLYNYYKNNDIMPRLYHCFAECISSKNGELVKGGDFLFTFFAVSLMDDEINLPLKEELNHVELVEKYIKLWQTGDVSEILEYLDKDLRNSSEFVLDILVSRKEYIRFFTHEKTAAYRNRGLTLEIGKIPSTGEIGVIVKSSQGQYFVSVDTANGRIKYIKTNRLPEEAILYDPLKELYQTHGDHIEALMPSDSFVNDFLPQMIDESSILYTIDDSDVLNRDLVVTSLKYSSGNNSILSLLVKRNDSDHYAFTSCYPYLNGRKYNVVIDEVIQWDDKVQATIKAHIGSFYFAFFATDYYLHREKFKKGELLPIKISALGIDVKPGQEGFTYTGAEAINFLEKMGQIPEYDADGEVIPVKFSTKNLVAFFINDERCPDEAEFQSPTCLVNTENMFDSSFMKCEIILNREQDITIPLYFRKQYYPDLEIGKPICGRLWLMGGIMSEE